MTTEFQHIPVMGKEAVQALKPVEGGLYVDGTFGRGGYTRLLLETTPCRVIAIDRDPQAIAAAEKIKADFPDRFEIRKGCFGDMQDLLQDVPHIDGIVLDIGVSSPQLDQADRGFSFQKDGPLDMRMGDTGPTVADILEKIDETDLANVIYEYGEEKLSRRIARAIVKTRDTQKISTTKQLADIVRAVVPKNKNGTDPATRTFQALRIYVNDELGELKRALAASETLLTEGGRLSVVTFHSLEDRLVKNFMFEASGNVPSPSRHNPISLQAPEKPQFKLDKKKARTASDAEIAQNPRARSAKLRVAIRTDVPSRQKENK